jgi:hypothetical protein
MREADMAPDRWRPLPCAGLPILAIVDAPNWR